MKPSAMRQIYVLSTALLVTVSTAQTPDGFTPKVSQMLSVTYGSITVQPGATLQKEQVQEAPTIAVGTGAHNGTFIFMMLDLDVPVKSNNTVVGRQTLLHDLSGNFTEAADSNTLRSSTLDEAPAPYIGPSPPAENPPVPHRYVQLLFEQPSNFNVPESQTAAVEKRIGFNLSEFISAAGLSPPIQANFFEIVNNTLARAADATGSGAMHGTGTGTMSTATGTLTPDAFTGAGYANRVNRLGVAMAAGAVMLVL